jgi:hypothetical protein
MSSSFARRSPRFRVCNELPEDRYEAFLSVPVLSRGKLVGVINVQHRQPHDRDRREIQPACAAIASGPVVASTHESYFGRVAIATVAIVLMLMSVSPVSAPRLPRMATATLAD